MVLEEPDNGFFFLRLREPSRDLLDQRRVLVHEDLGFQFALEEQEADEAADVREETVIKVARQLLDHVLEKQAGFGIW